MLTRSRTAKGTLPWMFLLRMLSLISMADDPVVLVAQVVAIDGWVIYGNNHVCGQRTLEDILSVLYFNNSLWLLATDAAPGEYHHCVVLLLQTVCLQTYNILHCSARVS